MAIQADTDREETAERSPGEMCARAFARYYKIERERAEKCLSDIADILLDPNGAMPLTSIDLRIVDRYIAHLQRTEGDRTDDPTSDSGSLKQNPNKEG